MVFSFKAIHNARPYCLCMDMVDSISQFTHSKNWKQEFLLYLYTMYERQNLVNQKKTFEYTQDYVRS